MASRAMHSLRAGTRPNDRLVVARRASRGKRLACAANAARRTYVRACAIANDALGFDVVAMRRVCAAAVPCPKHTRKIPPFWGPVLERKREQTTLSPEVVYLFFGRAPLRGCAGGTRRLYAPVNYHGLWNRNQ